MSYLPIAADLAVRATRNQMNGKRPSTAATAPRRVRPRHRVRAHVASGLHRIAGALEPNERPMTPGQAVG
jgi:hypothetical protein